MKKFTTFLAAAALTALSMNAQVYIVGDFQGWNISNPTVIQPGATGYDFTLNSVGEFKMSSANPNGEWDTFNEGAFTTIKSITGAGEYDLFSSNMNTILPWKGNWHFTFNESKNVMIATTTTLCPTLYLRGDMNGWGATSENEFTTTNNIKFVLENVTINAGQSFKVSTSDWDSYLNFGGVINIPEAAFCTLERNGDNCTVAQNYTGTVTMFISGPHARQIYLGEVEDEIEPTERELFLVGDNYGNWNSTDSSLKFTSEEDNVYTLHMPDGITGGWKIWDGTWAYNFGGNGQALVLGEEGDAWFNAGANFSFTTTEDVDIVFTLTEGSDLQGSSIPSRILVRSHIINGVDAIDADANAPAVYYNMQGVRVANPEKGMYIVVRGGKATKELVR